MSFLYIYDCLEAKVLFISFFIFLKIETSNFSKMFISKDNSNVKSKPLIWINSSIILNLFSSKVSE